MTLLQNLLSHLIIISFCFVVICRRNIQRNLTHNKLILQILNQQQHIHHNNNNLNIYLNNNNNNNNSLIRNNSNSLTYNSLIRNSNKTLISNHNNNNNNKQVMYKILILNMVHLLLSYRIINL